MKKNFIKIFSVVLATLVLFFVGIITNAYTFAKSGLCYFASTQFGEDASTMATIHFHSENKDVYAMLTTADDTTFANAVKVELEKVLVDFSTPLPSKPDVPVEQDEDFPETSYECTGRLTDLKPNTDYMWYATDGTNNGAVHNFRTADGDNTAYTFTLTTDPQTYTGSGVRFGDYYDWSENIYTTAEKNGMNIDFIVSSGDQVENSGRATHWSYLFEPDHWRKSAYMAAPGNHDFTGLISSGGVDGRYFAAQYGNPLNGPETVYEEICYYYIYNDTLFVVLSCSGANRTAQVEWLDQVLKNNPAKYKIINMHYPANSDATDNSKEFIPVYDKYNVDLVFFGHTHTYAVQKNYYNRKASSDKNIGTTYISASSPEGDYGNPVVNQLFFTVNESIISYKGFTPDCVLHESFALSSKRANTADTKNYNEEEFIASLKADIDQDSLNKGKLLYDASAYNNVYKITVMNGETELASRYVTDSVNNYITLSGLTPQSEYNTKIILEYYDGTTKEVDFAFHTRIASYGSLDKLEIEDSSYGYRFKYTPNFRSEVKSLKVYVNDTVVLEPKVTDKRFNIPYESFTDGIVNKIEVKGVLEDGSEVLIHEATYGEEAAGFKVTFKDKDGNVLQEVKVEEGQAATAPAAPEVEGYVFKGWDKDFSNITGDLEVNAQYAKVYNVVFKDKDGNVIEEVKAEEGQAATAPAAPEVEGYKFAGWDKEFTNVTADLEVTAQYAKVYNVVFKGKDGSVIATVEVEEGKAATAPAAPEVEGFVFKGWDKEFANVTADLEVTAQYDAAAKKYTVTFKDKDGKEIAKVEVEEGKGATAPNAPEVEGFVFKGWDKEFANVTADLVVTAQYEKAGCGNAASILFTSLLLLGLVLIRRKEW